MGLVTRNKSYLCLLLEDERQDLMSPSSAAAYHIISYHIILCKSYDFIIILSAM